MLELPNNLVGAVQLGFRSCERAREEDAIASGHQQLIAKLDG